MKPSNFPIVGLGASAGGLDAFRSFFEAMPTDCGMAFVLILHLPADRKSLLPEILSRWTGMSVVEGTDGAVVQPNHVYVPPPHSIVTLVDGLLRIAMPSHDQKKIFRPIDAFFGALGDALRDQAVGIILSGTGNDGALGLKAIKEAGGLTIAQGTDGTAPQYDEMPAGAIATGSVDLVLFVERIPAELIRIRGGRLASLAEDEPSPQVDTVRLEICEIIRSQLGHDFSGYRDKTFLRRVHRRMQVIGVDTFSEYPVWLRSHPEEVVSLFRDLLIRVTSFFRDTSTFEALATIAVPRLFAGKDATGSVRIWVPGCATGEEAYSLAILMHEYMSKASGAPKVQIFATDIDESAITIARLGRYPQSMLEGLSPERRERYFTASAGSFVVSKDIRELCTFSIHNVVRDPPFSRMDLVSCRNLLIYMDTELQGAVIPLFHYSLVRRGILLLGGSESAARHDNLFASLDKASRIFERRDGLSPSLSLDPRGSDLMSHRDALRSKPAGPTPKPGWDVAQPVADRTSGESFRDRPIELSEIDTSADSFFRRSWLSLRRLLDVDGERQLHSSREQFKALAEEHQTALEELRSTNEELHSVNEEMQSANEELETSKEELQSVNEELHTVNARLSEKVEELDIANSDLRNLFESTQIATIFLDTNLIIRSFTPAIGTLYNLIPSDQGRPLTDIVTRLNYSRMREDVMIVLQTLEPLERRIAHKDGKTYFIMRILAYREPDSRVTGVLVTFVDVTSIVEAENALRDADLRKDIFLATLSHELRNPLAPIRTAALVLSSKNLSQQNLDRARAIISRQAAHMGSLLDDLLDVSRITKGSFSLKRDYVEVRSLLEAAIEVIQPVIDTKGHQLIVDQPDDPILVDVDPVRITQVISNVLTNAAKYTPAGGTIKIGSRVEPQGLVINVADTGIGFAQGSVQTIFNMFTRLSGDSERADEGGLGIGLALSKGLMELHGGDIKARSDGPGKGSEFLITLPPSRLVHAAPPVPPPFGMGTAPVVARQVLIVDDSRDGIESLEMFLEIAGHHPLPAYSGQEAFAIAEQHRPQFAVMDIGLPDMTGYELARRIKAEPWGKTIILIAVTGWGQDDDKREAMAAGFDHHFTKPVDPEQLIALLK